MLTRWLELQQPSCTTRPGPHLSRVVEQSGDFIKLPRLFSLQFVLCLKIKLLFCLRSFYSSLTIIWEHNSLFSKLVSSCHSQTLLKTLMRCTHRTPHTHYSFSFLRFLTFLRGSSILTDRWIGCELFAFKW